MGRQIILRGQHEPVHLREVLADNEAQLQSQMQGHPELLPIEELGLEGPMLILGRETTLASGAADLLGMAPSGDIVIVEFKTGPQNSDFRQALAQLLDYGAALWGMEPDEFESAVVRRYLQGDACPADAPARGSATVTEAAERTWIGRSEEDVELFAQRWPRCLRDGAFHYVIAAQRFTATMERTIEHLNDQVRTARIYAVEVVRFAGAGWEAFEGRSVTKPSRSRGETQAGKTDEDELLERIESAEYRQALQQLLDFSRSQQLVLAWGSVGVSIRVRIPGENQPITIAWLFPPGKAGWSGLTDLTLGYDRGQVRSRLGDRDHPALVRYLERVGSLLEVEKVDFRHVVGWRIPPAVVAEQASSITETIASLISDISAPAS